MQNLPKQIIKKLIQPIRNYNSKKIYIHSFGGVGTRTFYEFIKKYRPVNGQVNVHNGFPPELHHQERMVYLYGNPCEAVMSFYRRNLELNGWFKNEYCKINNLENFEANTLEEYIEMGKDYYQLENHFDKYSTQDKFPMLLIKYEKLWDNLDYILAYLNLESYKSDFPKKRERNSKFKNLSESQQEKFLRIHERLINKMNKFPDIYVLNES
jgi:hypothetical protein